MAVTMPTDYRFNVPIYTQDLEPIWDAINNLGYRIDVVNERLDKIQEEFSEVKRRARDSLATNAMEWEKL
jgi:hypothetical protein